MNATATTKCRRCSKTWVRTTPDESCPHCGFNEQASREYNACAHEGIGPLLLTSLLPPAANELPPRDSIITVSVTGREFEATVIGSGSGLVIVEDAAGCRTHITWNVALQAWMMSGQQVEFRKAIR